ncbi:MAG: hypothetical protein JSV96_16250 [Candidatus Aminicenantes bacterium]|nr:MAG: hypothetical protein JSV96_16250 [Candidatus Aminicenantes bacterium]
MKLRSRKFILILGSSLLMWVSMHPQESKLSQLKYKGKTYPLYPRMIDNLPDIPSPFTVKNGVEIVIGFTKGKKYALIPVTVENGEPYKYARSGKGKQLEVDAKDFPSLASTGLHSEIELDQTKTITGKSIGEITYLGRPGRSSGEGFMSHDEDIISVLKGDNRLVKKLGLTHRQTAKALFHMWNLILKQIEVYYYYNDGRPWGEVEYFLYNKKKIFLEVGTTKGWQESIFNDEIYGGCHINISRELSQDEKGYLNKKYSHLNPEQMEELIKKLSRIHTGEMEPYYVMRYGFYEGHTDYRVDPIAIAFIFGLRSIEEIEGEFERNLHKVLTEHFTKENIKSE